MIREFSQKNNIFYLAFLCAELAPVSNDMLNYAYKTDKEIFIDKLINSPLLELHEYLTKISLEMNKETRKTINGLLYS